MKKVTAILTAAGLGITGMIAVIRAKIQDKKLVKAQQENLELLDECTKELQAMTKEMEERTRIFDEVFKEIERAMAECDPEKEPWSKEELQAAIDSFGEV